jgi:hypothetical protein
VVPLISEGGCRKTSLNRRKHFVDSVVHAFQSAGVSYVVLHGSEPEYQPDSDLDVAVDRAGLDTVDALARSGVFGRLVQRLDYDVPWCRYYVFRTEAAERRYRALDIACDPWGVGRYGAALPLALSRRLDRAGVSVPDVAAQTAYLVAKRASKGLQPSERRALIASFRRNSAGSKALLEHAFPRTGRAMAVALDQEKADLEEELIDVRRELRRRRRAPMYLVRRAGFSALRLARRFASPTGLIVTIVGPDGSGKSTLAEALPGSCAGAFRRAVQSHWRPGLLPRPGALLGRRGPDSSTPHARPGFGRMLSLVLLFYYWLDFFLGGWLRLWPARARTGLVVVQRGWFDIGVDPRRYRLQVSPRLVRLLGRTLPKADLVLILEAGAESLGERKAELPEEELERQAREWRDAPPSGRRCVRLDARLPAEQLVEAAEDEVVRLLESRAISRLGRGWTGPPRGGSPRWMIPRGPRKAARSALRVYQPITLRAQFGWELARLFATAGGFATLPRGQAPPPAVWAALAPHVPPRGTFAVARANHAGRFAALVVDEHGECHALGKVATDDQGRRALSREAEAISTLGDLLPAPLFAPRVLMHSNELLLLEAVPWRPRRRPWRVPEEVAYALGCFVRAGTRGEDATFGPAHGDCAPWNLLATDEGWALIDWENARDRGSPFSDLAHYLVQAHALLGRPSRPQLVSGLRGAGWVAATIGAYAAGAHLSAGDAPEFFIDYLKASTRTLDTRTAEGRAGWRARRQLVVALNG